MKFTEDKKKLKKVIDSGGWTVAHTQASHGWVTEDKEILKLMDQSVAHVQAEHGWVTEDKEILNLVNCNGWTVAHYQIKCGWIPPEHLRNLKINEETLWEMYTQIALKCL